MYIKIITVLLLVLNNFYTQDSNDENNAQVSTVPLEYNYLQNGLDWELGECLTGNEQSPVNIQFEDSVCQKFLRGRFIFRNQQQTLKTMYPQPDNNLTVITAEINVGDYMATSIWKKLWSYTSQKMELRAPSEHTVNGQHYSAELQIHFTIKEEVFDQAEYMMGDSFRQFGTISIFLEADNSVSATDTILGPNGWDIQNIDEELEINPYEMFDSIFPHTGEFYTYEGSLNYPPCSENVSWYIYRDPLPISQSQLNKIESVLQNPLLLDKQLDGEGNEIGEPSNIRSPNGNNRNTNVLYGRKVFRGGPEMECVYDNPGFYKREKETVYETSGSQILVYISSIFLIIQLLLL